MRPLWIAIVGAGGRGRAALVVASTALVSGLLLVAVSYARLGDWNHYGYRASGGNAPLLGPIGDPGTRPGAIIAVVLMTLPVALLLDQCVRLGAAAQQRRYRALAVAGATRRDLRRWGAVETGLPALLGSALGVPVWLLLRLLLGDAPADAGRGTLVPTATGPGWWALVAIAVVAAYGALMGRRAATRATAELRRERRPPRPWGLLVLALAVVTVVRAPAAPDVVIFVAVALAVVGVMTTTPWLAYALSGSATRRAESAAVLLATRRIRADHGAAGRAAAGVGAVGLTLGVLGVFVADVASTGESIGDRNYYLVPAVLVGVLALIALGVITLSLSLHSIESTLARRREMSALVATGVPVQVLQQANRVECRLVTLPVTLGATLLGAAAYTLAGGSPVEAVGGLVAVLVAGGAVLLAAQLASLATRPWLREAVATGNLRTE